MYIIDFPFFPKWRKSGIHWILSSTFGAELHIWPFLSKFDYFFQTVSKTLGRAHLTENFVKTLWKTFKTTRTSPSPLTKKSVCSKWRKHQVSDLNWIWVQEMILLLNSLTIRTSGRFFREVPKKYWIGCLHLTFCCSRHGKLNLNDFKKV